MLIYNSSKGYGAIPQAVHWLTVILVAVAWTFGLFGDDLPKGTPRDAGLFVHISAGLAVIALLVVRVAWNSDRPTATRRTDNAWRLVRPFGEGDSLPALCPADRGSCRRDSSAIRAW